MTRVWAAMSGGIDSSVAVARLLAGDRDVRGVTMRVLPPGTSERYDESIAAAVRAASALGVPHDVVDLAGEFERRVLRSVADAYAAGRTPNPCVICNEHVKFGLLFDWAASRAPGDLFATGHYARTAVSPGGCTQLLRAIDRSKDQSYFLYRLASRTLASSLFPVGASLKREIAEEGRRLGLPAKDRPESQDLCFVGPGRLVERILALRPDAAVPGEIVDAQGTVLGEHRGLAFYTVGQRKGLGVPGPGRLHVAAIDAQRNRLVVAPGEELGAMDVTALDPVWRAPEAESVHCEAQVRYRSRAVTATAVSEGTILRVRFDEPVFGVAPGQAIVCYAGDVCLGGGEIETAR